MVVTESERKQRQEKEGKRLGSVEREEMVVLVSIMMGTCIIIITQRLLQGTTIHINTHMNMKMEEEDTIMMNT